jgi:hypothetical protein
MTSVFFQLSPKILLEYQYDSKTFNTNVNGFRKIKNYYDQSLLITSTNNSKQTTRNVVDYSAVELDNGNYALLDIDTAYFYPNVDSNIEISDIIIPVPQNVAYDRVRIHLVSGYNFDDIQGFVFSLFVRSTKDTVTKLCQIAYKKGDSELLFFSPKAKKISELIYDKYIEFYIPSHKFLLNQQLITPSNPNLPAYLFTENEGLKNVDSIYCEFVEIRNIFEKEGSIFLESSERKKFVFNNKDQYDLLEAFIQENNKGYFEYSAKWDNGSIEDFIFALNSLAGNNYYIIHEISVIEQVGEGFITTDNFTRIQNSGYDDLLRFKPILKTTNSTSVSIEYTIRLYNSADGRSIIKQSSITSMNVNRYAEENFLKLNIGNTTQPIKVYNKIVKKNFEVINNRLAEKQIVISYVYVNNLNITINSNKLIQITPFDNTFLFDIVDENMKGIELSPLNSHYLTFINNDGSKLYVAEILSNDFNKFEGELAFTITSERAKQILELTNDIFYIVAKSPNGTESVIADGKWTNKKEVTNENIQ